jgi:hypothetical protein
VYGTIEGLVHKSQLGQLLDVRTEIEEARQTIGTQFVHVDGHLKLGAL